MSNGMQLGPAIRSGVEVTFERDELTAEGGVVEYGVHVASCTPGRPGRSGHWLDPSSVDGEVELAPFVTVYVEGVEVGVTTLATALLAYAADRKLTLDQAWRQVEDKAYEAACELEAQRDDDARASWAEDRAEAGRYW